MASEALAAASALSCNEEDGEGGGDGDVGCVLEDGAENDDDEDDEYHLFRSLDAEDGADKDPLLVLWPPAQRQVRRGLVPFVMHSAESLLICVASETMDVFPLLSWSGLMDALDRFNLVPQVKRATIASSANAKIRICVDQNICPGRHRYELQVTAERTYLSASDNVGLLYGIYSFIQLVQLHSQIKVYGDGVTAVEVPPVCLTDWPDMPQRAVMWSYRHGAQAAFAQMRENVELFSRLRLNVLLLVIDASNIEEYTQADNDQKRRELSSGLMDNDKNDDKTTDGVSVATATATASVGNEEMEHEPPTTISALDEICTNLCVELVPTIIINSVFERYHLYSLCSILPLPIFCLLYNLFFPSPPSLPSAHPPFYLPNHPVQIFYCVKYMLYPLFRCYSLMGYMYMYWFDLTFSLILYTLFLSFVSSFLFPLMFQVAANDFESFFPFCHHRHIHLRFTFNSYCHCRKRKCIHSVIVIRWRR